MNDVTKIYGNNAKGVTRVSLDIEKGDFAFIVGSSGSGKSTLIRLMLKEIEPSHGDIIINDVVLKSLTRKSVPYFRRRMGVVFQDFRLLPSKTVYENVAFAMQTVQAAHRDIRRNVPAVLAMVGLQKKAKAYPNQLSGGEQQSVSLARAIVNKPALLLADEPTGNLDPETAWEIMTLLEDINELGTTTVVATHAKEIVDRMKKRVITIQNGMIARDIEKGGYSDEI
ncbi:MAG: cell division ATP-binding protein FtsE [Clostridiales bacterium]|jgi:cell division transport system ATP-binding protein|nr:cell division ATP-binding protein FtsE [Clostridiales bacterium]